MSRPKKRSTKSKREKRKRYRTKKKELWKELALHAYQKRCQERMANSNAIQEAEIEEMKEREEKERLRANELSELKKTQITLRNEDIEHIEDTYMHLAETSEPISDTNSTSPLLLDAIVAPLSEPSCSCSPIEYTAGCKQELVSARRQRDDALALARQYRNLAEKGRSKSRQQKHELEEKVELVRNFWRNKIIEGGCRSGRMLRAALIK